MKENVGNASGPSSAEKHENVRLKPLIQNK